MMALSSSWLIYGLTGAILVGIGLFGFASHTNLLRKILSFNVIGSGIFLVFGSTGFRVPELGADAVPQALIITGIVVALSATAIAVGLIARHARLSGSATLPEDEPEVR